MNSAIAEHRLTCATHSESFQRRFIFLSLSVLFAFVVKDETGALLLRHSVIYVTLSNNKQILMLMIWTVKRTRECKRT